MVVEANTLLNHETKVAMVGPAGAVAMAVAGVSNYSQKTKLSRRGEPEKLQVTTDCELSQTPWVVAGPSCYKEDMC
ncbi:hypothetical protein I79_006751 [Cricetulus griseus]|uniref:Uncharacterized protein n=1 Tax=Cricetulus griseus TaxID=10029 RepID=G3H8P3_CRIGR|nr:hypothetical protein I79_006751 [Cricetulus griseus]